MPSYSSSNLCSRFGFFVVTLLIGAAARGQEANRTVEETYQFDERGDAKIEINFQLGAKEWAQWKYQRGDHPDIVLRNLKYQLAAAVLDDAGFQMEKDEVHRRAFERVTARALANYRSGGQFEIDVRRRINESREQLEPTHIVCLVDFPFVPREIAGERDDCGDAAAIAQGNRKAIAPNAVIQGVGKESLRRRLVNGQVSPIERLISLSSVKNHGVGAHIFLHEISVLP